MNSSKIFVPQVKWLLLHPFYKIKENEFDIILQEMYLNYFKTSSKVVNTGGTAKMPSNHISYLYPTIQRRNLPQSSLQIKSLQQFNNPTKIHLKNPI